MPRTYVPKSLRVLDQVPRPEVWAIGIDRGEGSYGMTHGPFQTEEEALDTVPQLDSVIVRFHPDGTQTFPWRWADTCWVEA